jgi:glutamate racemase
MVWLPILFLLRKTYCVTLGSSRTTHYAARITRHSSLITMNFPIGLFDSGVGGLSVWREIAAQLPQENTLYFADQIHIPYGPRSLEQIRSFSEAITRYLIDQGCKLIVVACNTASAAALKYLRAAFPEVPFVGMEPAVKPAAEHTRTGVVGVMATPATFQGELFASVVERFANGVKLINQICPGLVEQIEAGQLDAPETVALLDRFLAPIRSGGADTIVLACTHYPFVIDAIRQLAPGIDVIDPAPAIARQINRVLSERGLLASAEQIGQHRFVTSGDRARFRSTAGALVQIEPSTELAIWTEERVITA